MHRSSPLNRIPLPRHKHRSCAKARASPSTSHSTQHAAIPVMKCIRASPSDYQTNHPKVHIKWSPIVGSLYFGHLTAGYLYRITNTLMDRITVHLAQIKHCLVHGRWIAQRAGTGLVICCSSSIIKTIIFSTAHRTPTPTPTTQTANAVILLLFLHIRLNDE
jgi:hypothetical protein